MFTGLIEETGTIRTVDTTADGSRMVVDAQKVLEDAKLGNSIAIDGVCTTVIALDAEGFVIEASPETLSKTTFRHLKPGTRVNLERPLLPTSRLGGHFVSGHVDGTAMVLSRLPEGNSVVFHFKLDDADLAKFFVEKGSVALSGISLTVNTVVDDVFSVAIIPHTLANTSIAELQAGDTVNIETDILGKYVARLTLSGQKEGMYERAR